MTEGLHAAFTAALATPALAPRPTVTLERRRAKIERLLTHPATAPAEREAARAALRRIAA